MKNKKLFPRITGMPYYNTKVSAERTKAEIISLLEKYGIESHQWTKLESKETLKFIIDTIVQGTQVKRAVEFQIPTIKAVYGHYDKVIDVPIQQTYRIFFHALKAVLESTKFGIMRLEHLLFSYTLTQLPTGETVQVKDLLEEHPLLLQTGFREID